MGKIKIKKRKAPESPVASLSEYYPEVSFDEKQLPQIKDWEVGKKYKLELEVEMISKSKSQYDAGEPHRASFKVTSVEEDTDD